MADAFRARAADRLDLEFQCEYRDMFLMHRGIERRDLSFHKTQLHSFARNREVAELRYAARLHRIEDRKEHVAANLRRQQNSVGGRLARLTKAGRARQAAQWERLEDRAAQLRGRATRQFNALTERQFQAEQKDRIFRARAMKQMREEHLHERRVHQMYHRDTREQRVDDLTRTMQRAEAERTPKHELQQHGRQQGRGIGR
jgi:hypothetical protein